MRRRVLILCTANSCRSQMAEGIWRELGGDAWEPRSAGSRPAGGVHPLAVEAMREIGIDIASARSKSLEDLRGESFDLAVTVCDAAGRACPSPPGGAREILHWPLDDPGAAAGTLEERRGAFRRVRDEIRARIEAYLRDHPA